MNGLVPSSCDAQICSPSQMKPKWSEFCKSWPTCLGCVYYFFCLLTKLLVSLPLLAILAVCRIFLLTFCMTVRLYTFHLHVKWWRFNEKKKYDGKCYTKIHHFSNVDCRFISFFSFQSSSFHLILFNLHLSCFISFTKSKS